MDQFTALLVFILVPGILGVLILGTIVPSKSWSPFRYVVYATVVGIVAYLIAQLLWRGITPAVWDELRGSTLVVWGDLLGEGANFRVAEVLGGIGLAIPLAFFFGWVVNRKFINLFEVRGRKHLLLLSEH